MKKIFTSDLSQKTIKYIKKIPFTQFFKFTRAEHTHLGKCKKRGKKMPGKVVTCSYCGKILFEENKRLFQKMRTPHANYRGISYNMPYTICPFCLTTGNYESKYIMANSDENTERMNIGDLKTYSSNVETVVKVVSMTEPREVSSRRDWSKHRLAEALVGDETGSIYLTLWDDAVDEIEEGRVLRLKNAFVKLYRGSMRLNLGRTGNYEFVDDAPFKEVNLDNNLSSKQFERSYGRPFGGRRYSGRSRRRY